MADRFTGKTVIVTGSGSGIGAQTVRRFAAEGADVVVCDIDEAKARAVAETIPGSLAHPVDVTRRDSLQTLIEATIERFGPIDVWVNNAMTCGPPSLLEITEEQIHTDLDTNLVGPLLAAQLIIPGMIAAGGGVILNLASVNALAYFGNSAYSAAKAGLISLTRSISVEFGRHGIRCAGVAPGTVHTESWQANLAVDPDALVRAARHYPLGRVGQPDDIASALLFLASDEASWITGEILRVDGGLLASNMAFTERLLEAVESRVGSEPTED